MEVIKVVFMLKLIRFIYRFPIMFRYAYLLAHKKYSRLENSYKKRLKKNKNDFLGLYFDYYLKLEINKIDEAENTFWTIRSNYKVGKKMYASYIDKILRKRINQKEYAEVKKKCEELLTDDMGTKERILILRVLCECSYYLHEFDSVKYYCDELLKYPELEIPSFVRGYLNAIAKESE